MLRSDLLFFFTAAALFPVSVLVLWRARQWKKLEQAQHEFIDTVSHELRTPLGSIRDAASMLAAGEYGKLPPKATQATVLIHQTATRLLVLSETFLAASRLAAGVLYTHERVATDVAQDVRHILDELMPLAKHKRLTLSSTIDASVPSRLMLHREAFLVTLFNLLDNAIKYTSRGGVRVTCRYDEGNRLSVEVSDTGNGFTQEECRTIFDQFRRGSAARSSHNATGSGLGLTIVKRILEASGGEIIAASDGIGKGARFTFSLPVL